ncbi:MAG: PAS domain S-box protein [Zetaproteobacteria bacterium]|nr:MAG: PAS domain S-box protein [Zetaproteobacteria bacterium]
MHMRQQSEFFDDATVARLFPFYFTFGRDHKIVSMGPALKKLPQPPAPGRDWRETFALKTPAHIAPEFDAICACAHDVFALQAKSGDLELTGEMLLGKDGNALMFLGTPVIHELDELETLGLKASDFSRHDQAHYLAALQQQKQSLREKHRRLNELEKVHRELQDSELKFRQLTETMREVFWMTDPEKNTMLYISPGYEEIWGRSCESLYAHPSNWLDAIHPEDRERVMQAAMTKQISGEYNEEYRIIRPDGSIRWIRDRAYPVRDEQGKVFRVTGIATDITEQKENERARLERQRLESIGLLAGGIAHDFNNLLAAIVGKAELIKMRLTDNAAMLRKHLDAILASSEKAAELCQQMLAYSGKGKMVIEPVDLAAKTREIADVLKAAIGRNVELKLALPETLPPIEGDAVQLQQVVMNLIINAAEAIADRNGVVSVRAGVMHADRKYLKSTRFDNDLPAGEYVYLEVSDTGCGMDDKTQDKMFEPFFTTKFVGRGLGLSAVMGILRSHRGAIKIDTRPGYGTTIRVLLPASGDRAEQAPAISAASEASRFSGTILIVDDEDIVRETAAMLLEDLGFHSLQAVDGEDGVRKYQEHRHRITGVLLDMSMPKLDGKGCLRELKRINPNVKVVLSSGYSAQEVNRQFAGMSLAGFVQKPYRLQHLEKVLRRAFANT